MWDGDVSSLQREDGAKPVQDMPDDVMIMDRAGLRALGLVL
jgi:microsomal dipeptidase-like Zn-dependent dipeptidase